ncbi:unnamed protein product [Taenia asiatica]|uniref:CACTA en-spm transposon protein n=1 Tax=Taenia asiatica TaxID=60517 RepID=A0A0R3WAN9_TAEAS|nr:unnamed protein product [Taenia asiatica]
MRRWVNFFDPSIRLEVVLDMTPFNPGNRVTVWKDEFYCVCCSQSLSSRQVAVAASGGKGLISPLSLKQNRDNTQQTQSQQQSTQQQPRLSFADYPSPVSFVEDSMESRVTPPVQKTSGSILKSSLRQSRTMQPVSTASNSKTTSTSHFYSILAGYDWKCLRPGAHIFLSRF